MFFLLYESPLSSCSASFILFIVIVRCPCFPLFRFLRLLLLSLRLQVRIEHSCVLIPILNLVNFKLELIGATAFRKS